jgi:hypothetical protein
MNHLASIDVRQMFRWSYTAFRCGFLKVLRNSARGGTLTRTVSRVVSVGLEIPSSRDDGVLSC